MNDPSPTATPDAAAVSHHTALFANLVMQQTNMALIFLGQSPHPQTGETTTDIEASSVFIDTLDMLALKTKGNLSRTEADLLQQSLTNLRMAFVAAADAQSTAAPSASPSPSAPAPPAPNTTAPAPDGNTPADAAPAEDPRKKFVTKY